MTVGQPHETHPLFADRPELDDLAFAMVHRLHAQIPADKRPTSWSDFTEAQVLRAKEAAALAYDAGRESVSAKARLDAIVEAATKIGECIKRSSLITREDRAATSAFIAAQNAVLSMRKLDPRDPDPFFPGIFYANTCGYCSDGRLPCKRGASYRCDYPRARND